MAKIDSIYDFSDKGLVEVKSWLEPWFLTRCPCAAGATAIPPFFDSVIDLGATHNLLGYWRLGDGASPFADSNPYMTAFPLSKVSGASAMNLNLSPGALPAGQDDGAVEFPNPGGYSGGSASDYLSANIDTRFNISTDMTFAAWVNPTASGSSFTGGIGGTRTYSTFDYGGWGLTMDWPSRVITWHRNRNVLGSDTTLVGPVLPAATWTFVVATYNSSAGSRLYMNGALVATDAVSLATSSPNVGIKLGATQDAAGHALSFYGGIDEVSVWGDDLSAANVLSLYESGGVATSTGYLSYVVATGTYTAAAGDDVVLANGTFTVSLPTAAGRGGKQYTVKNTGVGTVTVDPAGSETIDGSATVSLATLKAVTVVSDGTNWAAIGGY